MKVPLFVEFSPKRKLSLLGAFNKSIWEDLTKRVESKEILFKGGGCRADQLLLWIVYGGVRWQAGRIRADWAIAMHWTTSGDKVSIVLFHVCLKFATKSVF